MRGKEKRDETENTYWVKCGANVLKSSLKIPTASQESHKEPDEI